jgi:hypothetical protein
MQWMDAYFMLVKKVLNMALQHMRNGMYKILAIVGVLIVSHAGTAYYANKSGYNDCRAETAEAIAESTEDDHVKSNEVIKWKIEEKVIYRDRVQEVKVAADPTGCLDTDLRDVGLGGMLENNSN